MDNLIEFLTSSNAIIIYITCFVLCMGVFISYYLKKNSNKRRQKQNTKELENIVANEKEEKIETVVEQKEEIEPVTITKVVPLKNVDIIEELSKDIKEEPQVQEVKVQEEPTNVETNVTSETINKEEEKKKEVEELTYAPIELDQEQARKELERITQELTIKEEQSKKEELVEEKPVEEENIALTNFEKEQEENAIISLDELMAKASDIYEKNEEIQYQDEGNEPISIADLQAKWEEEKKKITAIEKDVVIEEVAPLTTVADVQKELTKKVEFDEHIAIAPIKEEQKPLRVPYKETEQGFKSSPIISPVYGIERKQFEEAEKINPPQINSNELALENTANYEKFDAEIRKTNEFIAALKELQKKLD